MDVKCSGASITVQPFYLSALNTLSKNYFGADKRAMAPEQLAERGGVNQAESEFQEQLRRLKGDLVNQSASHLTVHLQNSEFLLPRSLIGDNEFATESVPSLVIEMHSSYSKSSCSDMHAYRLCPFDHFFSSNALRKRCCRSQPPISRKMASATWCSKACTSRRPACWGQRLSSIVLLQFQRNCC